MAALAIPEVGLRVAMEWTVAGHEQSLTGEVVEHKIELDGKNEAIYEFKVKYDSDKAACWHTAEEMWEAAEEATDCDRGRVRVTDKCSITLQPLTQPARTRMCRHLPSCNMDALAALSKRKCPDCSATFRGQRCLVVDETMRKALSRARSANEDLWHSPRDNSFESLARNTPVTVVLLSEDEGSSCAAKRSRSVAPPPRLVPAVPLPQRDAPSPQASPMLEAAATTAAPAPRALFIKDKLALLKRELGIEPTTPAIPAVADAN